MASRQLNTLEDCKQAIRQIDGVLNKLTTKETDWHGRRIKNAAASVDGHDYVIQNELTSGLSLITLALTAFVNKIAQVLTIKKNDAYFDKGDVIIGPGELKLVDSDGAPKALAPEYGGTGGVGSFNPGDIVIGNPGGGGGQSTTTYIVLDQLPPDGLTSAITYYTSISATVTTLDFLDWASAPQSQIVVINLVVATGVLNFTNGLLTP